MYMCMYMCMYMEYRNMYAYNNIICIYMYMRQVRDYEGTIQDLRQQVQDARQQAQEELVARQVGKETYYSKRDLLQAIIPTRNAVARALSPHRVKNRQLLNSLIENTNILPCKSFALSSPPPFLLKYIITLTLCPMCTYIHIYIYTYIHI